MSIAYKYETFAPLLNKKFKVSFNEEISYSLELIEIKKGPPIASLNTQPFSLFFKGAPTETIYEQGNFRLSIEDLGEFGLFLIPRQPDEKGIYYEALIN